MRGASARLQSGQATTDFVLLVALVAIPVWLAVRALMQVVVRDFIVALIERFTQG
jgi:hypothetical protein